jgi:hypothetical protein
MIYSEAAYFDGAHVAHIAAWYERQRLKRIAQNNRRALDRRRFPR